MKYKTFQINKIELLPTGTQRRQVRGIRSTRIG